MRGNAKTSAGGPAEEIITKLAQHIDYFNKYSHPHSMRIADLAATLSSRLGLLRLDIEAIVEAGLLHDIGLYEMAPAYLSNPGPLSPEQRMDLWRHSILGEQAMARRNASRHSQLLVRWHHESWNGLGYPDMLSFEDIPIGARILRAVEMYCALTADRPYRSACGRDRALEFLRASAGVACDPFVVRELLAILHLTESLGTVGAAETGNSPQAAKPELLVTPEPPRGAESPAAIEPEPTQSAGPVPEPAEPEAPGSADSPVQAAPASPAAQEIHPTIGDYRQPRVFESAAAEAQSVTGPSRGWLSSPYMSESLLGFQVSVLRQIDFRTIAVPFCGAGQLVWYLSALGKHVLSNDPRPWAALAGRAAIESEPLGEDQVFRILQDTYIPGVRMTNPELRRWFGEADAWWMDNLRRKALEDPALQDQTLLLGLRAGEYAQSFGEATAELKRPLTVIFRELAASSQVGLAPHPHSRAYSMPPQQFLRDARADVMYLNLPAGQAGQGRSIGSSSWRDTWILGRAPNTADDFSLLARLPQSKKAYLEMVDRLLISAARIRKWAVECRDTGLASARDISDLIKAHRAIQATYSKDVTEVAGGLRNYIMVSEG